MATASDDTARAEALIERMRRDRGGKGHPEWEWASHVDTDFMEAYTEFSAKLLNPSYERHLDDRTRAYIQLVLLASRGLTSTLPGHIRRLLELGVSVEEILEVFEAAVLPSGAPTFFMGLQALMQVDAEDGLTGHPPVSGD